MTNVDFNPSDFIRVAGTTEYLSSTTTSGISLSVPISRDGGKMNLNPRLYFKYVKSKLVKSQKDILNERLSKLLPLYKYAQEMNQLALYEECAKKVVEIAQEQEAELLGFCYYIDRAVINKYRDSVRDKVIRFKPLSEFPRVIPVSIREKIREVQERQLFDDLLVLYTDFTDPKEDIKSTKQKIKEKDPIIFGVFKNQPNKMFYIADWVDEYCDLTFDKLVGVVGKLDSTFALPSVPVITDKLVGELKKEIQDRADKLNNTHRGNFVSLAASESTKKGKQGLIKKVFSRFICWCKK